MAGRPKGTTNHTSKMLKEMVLLALDDVGGRQYLARQANENPAAFIGLIGKIMPREVEMEIKRSLLEEEVVDGQEPAHPADKD
jgi:hypothetical protein